MTDSLRRAFIQASAAAMLVAASGAATKLLASEDKK